MNIYFAGKFHYDSRQLELWRRLSEDYRSLLTESSEILNITNADSICLPGGHSYVGCFYRDSDRSPDVTASAVVSADLAQIDRCDMLVTVFEDEVSVGSLTELLYAASKGKRLLLLYRRQATRYDIQSEYWFAMEACRKMTSTEIIEYQDYSELTGILSEWLEELR